MYASKNTGSWIVRDFADAISGINTNRLQPDTKESTGLKAQVEELRESVSFVLKDNHELRKQVGQVESELCHLRRVKIDKPSVAPELIDAERYIDDYLKLKSRYKKERWARKQRVKKKIEKMDGANKRTVKEHVDYYWPIYWMIAPLAIVCAAAILII